MDPLVHAAVSGLVAGKKNWSPAKAWPFIFWGVIPDGYTIVIFILAGLNVRQTVADPYFFPVYNVTHSLLVALTVGLIVWLVRKKFYWPLLMWPLHIVMDIFSHQGILTPWLWPISDYKISGLFDYQTPLAMIITYAILIPIITFAWLNKKFRADK